MASRPQDNILQGKNLWSNRVTTPVENLPFSLVLRKNKRPRSDNSSTNRSETESNNANHQNNNTMKYSEVAKKFQIKLLETKSLIHKADELFDYLNNFVCTFDVVAITETWLNDSTEDLICMNGFKFIGKNRLSKHGGGVGFYVSNNLTFKTRDDLNKLGGLDFETFAIELKTDPSTKNFVIVVLYRPPSCNAIYYLQQLEIILQQIDVENKHVVITGDLNIDMSDTNDDVNKMYLCQLFTCYSFDQLITFPTRISVEKQSIIDCFFTNFPQQVLVNPEDALNKHFISLAPNLMKDFTKNSEWKQTMHHKLSNSFFCLDTSFEEVVETAKSLRPKYSSGVDDIPSKIVISTINSTAQILSYLVNFSFATGIFPQCFKVAKVIPIAKQTGKMAKALGVINKVRFYVPRRTLNMLYNAICVAYISYCNVVWAGWLCKMSSSRARS
ncbi:hypothetical protein HELRODRAFT_172549 [Helobdella robusta]|uniref:Endonuclease/exonuclease/phosphatase domain-containing protein n=1 Tax=Helobdella robusta TaxID=6412 RepID=T1F5I0_HELRO|nr:hypothetical protein HELRODRAFT_172549 [Helobdella robusta]ESO04201.1 hypothetical protein HELRODRAFT_172549 [Helobdella robusta]